MVPFIAPPSQPLQYEEQRPNFFALSYSYLSYEEGGKIGELRNLIFGPEKPKA